MYPSYTATALSLRAKWSIYNSNVSFSGDHSSCCCCCRCSDGVPINPRSIYEYILNRSALIQWAPSRRLLAGGVRRCRLVPRSSDGGFREMIALLAEFDGVCGDSSGFSNDFKRRESGVRLRRDRSGLPCYSKESWSSSEDYEYGDEGRRREGYESSGNYRKRVGFDNVDEKVGRRENGARRVVRSSEMRDDEKERSSSSRKVSAWKARDEEEKADSLVDSYSEHRENYTEGERRRETSQKHGRMYAGDQEEVKRVSDSKRNSGVKIRDTEERSWSRDSGYEEREKHIHEGDSVISRRDARKGTNKSVTITEIREDDGTMASSSNNLVGARFSSSSAVKNHNKEDRRIAEHAESSMNSGRFAEASSEIHGTGIDRSSFSQKRFDETRVRNREDESSSYQHSVQVEGSKRRTANQDSLEQVDLSKQTTQYGGRAKVSGISHSQKQFEETRLRDIKESSTANQKTVQLARDTRARLDQQSVKEINLTKQALHYEDHTANLSRNSQSQKYFIDSRLEDVEDKSTSVQQTVELTRDDRRRLDQRTMERVNINKKYEDHTDISGVVSSDTERIRNSQKHVAARLDDQDKGSTHGVREHDNRSNDRLSQLDSSRQEFERYSQIYGSSRSNMQQTFGYQGSSKSRTEDSKGSSLFVLTHDVKDKQGTFIRRSSQSRGTQTTFSGSSESSSASGSRKILEQVEQTSADETYITKTDVLETASLFDRSSALYIDEFVDRARQEISASDQLDKVTGHSSEIKIQEIDGGLSERSADARFSILDSTSKCKDEKQVQESGRQSSSSRSGPKGPPDEMWEIRGPSFQDPSKEEHEVDSSPVGNVEPGTRTESAITQGSRRSLWTYIADIIRKGWVSNAESHASTLKSGTRSSSNESVSSEAWFSGNEPDEDDSENKEEGKGNSRKEISSRAPDDRSHSIIATSTKSPEIPTVEERVILLEGGRTASLKVSEGPSVVGGPESPRVEERLKLLGRSRTTPLKGSEGASLVSRPESLGHPKNEKEMEVLSSGIIVVGQSSAAVVESLSPTIQEELTATEMTKSEEELKIEKAPEVETMGKDMELKRRKLHRNKQVLKESFEEWEEAYNLESEQRKIDEFFMREALLEAKKAADSWEVPVGAVLVQNGKIIARGCNLVEEARDSTAHAEMICIREASNILRTWRLADTTLYVTLEPCAMCAGAILQARIDTLVWGAPNKLLGADGSWVRLFPGDGGSNSLDPSTEAGPVHPFHPKISIRRAVLAAECADAMQQFFRLRRKKDKKPEPSPSSCLPISAHPPKFLTKMHDLFYEAC
ncbi:tRNA(adenine(34)) deaminase protein [Dioscorea alata]|uniref:tRNA(Adenine(34)) deaminase protein n=1 Tax=Dioscorea alata TaxID=55571 RepID=A0ACB7UEJ5_DIOAL|nr:tRNA(adenine(34)) deaminase protein [Dioscorea alata]